MQFLRGSLTLELTHPLIHNMSLLSLCENRSLGIHVADMDVEEPSLLEKIGFEVEEENGEEEQKLENEAYSKVPRRQLMLIYSLHLAEAYAPPSTFSASLPSDFYVGSLHRVCNRSFTCCSVIASSAEALTPPTGLAWLRQCLRLVPLLVSPTIIVSEGFFSRGNSLRDRKAFTGAALGTSMDGGRLHS